MHYTTICMTKAQRVQPKSRSRWQVLVKGVKALGGWIKELINPIENPFDQAWNEIVNDHLLFEGAIA